MPRKLRVEFPGAIYHVMSRGDRREDIFQDDVDRQDFLKTLVETSQKTDFQVHAYCLMGNHFHLVVETPEANLVAGMRWLVISYGSSPKNSSARGGARRNCGSDGKAIRSSWRWRCG
jgi:REP element-mobilizing transposase RayT